MHNLQCAMHNAPCTLYNAQHNAQFTMNNSQYITHNTVTENIRVILSCDSNYLTLVNDVKVVKITM